MILQFSRILKTSLQHIVRNVKLSLASTLIMSLTFFVSTIFLIVLYGVSFILSYVESQSQLIVFFSAQNADSKYISSVEHLVRSQNVPVDILFVSKDEAYKRFVKFLSQESPTLSQGLKSDSLPPSIEVKTKNINDLGKIADAVNAEQQKNVNKIDRVLYFKNVEDFLNEFIRIVRYSGAFLFIFLGSISLLIVWITIGIALNSHADEIEIMRLVGATSAFIKLPYIIEGAIYGVAGAFLSSLIIIISYIVITLLKPSFYISFLAFFQGITLPTITMEQVILGVLIELLVGALIGAFGSFIALNKKLK